MKYLKAFTAEGDDFYPYTEYVVFNDIETLALCHGKEKDERYFLIQEVDMPVFLKEIEKAKQRIAERKAQEEREKKRKLFEQLKAELGEEYERGIPLGKPIVVFGGAFNPPTNAHLSLAEQIVNDYDIDKLLFMPVGDLYPKKDLIPAEFRVKMLEEVCKENEQFEVSRIEVDSDKCLSTIETLEILQIQYPNQEIWFVLGTDNLVQFHCWDNYEKILKKFKLLVLERGEDKALPIIERHSVLKKYKHNIIIMNEEIRTNCSSTIVRNRLKEGKGIKYLVPTPVYQYIQAHGLYR